MENHRQGKKKDVSLKYSNISTLSYNELKREFEKLQIEFLNANKRLASQEKVFTFLEAKVDETNDELEALKELIIDSSNHEKWTSLLTSMVVTHVKFDNKK